MPAEALRQLDKLFHAWSRKRSRLFASNRLVAASARDGPHPNEHRERTGRSNGKFEGRAPVRQGSSALGYSNRRKNNCKNDGAWASETVARWLPDPPTSGSRALHSAADAIVSCSNNSVLRLAAVRKECKSGDNQRLAQRTEATRTWSEAVFQLIGYNSNDFGFHNPDAFVLNARVIGAEPGEYVSLTLRVRVNTSIDLRVRA